MNSSTPENEKPINNGPDINETMGQSAIPIDLFNDPDFQKLTEHYQHAEFDKCKEVLTRLEKRYPGHPSLIKFKDDLQMQLSLKTMAVSNKKEQKHKVRKTTLKMSVFAVVSTILVMVIFFFSYLYIYNDNRIKQLEKETAQLTSLNNQAEQLLLAGQPQPAVKIIERLRSINPEYANLPDLTSKSEDLLRLETKYQAAQNLATKNKNSEALVILKEIEAEKPGLWDVGQQIASIETSIQIAKYMEEGNAAYQVENWEKVFSSYENALRLDPKLDDPLMKEQLLKGYLNKIVSLLQNKSNSIEDIENAEQYYRRAVALIPQSKAYASERGNLQEVSSDLLVLKFTQTAKAILEDKKQTVTSVAQAVSYLSKAANIKPKNTALQSDLINAEYYQIGFQNFMEMEWVPAITNFAEIVSVDSNFANGNASLLLYEAYYALGRQYYSVGLFLDARRNLEQAEILAWSDGGNLMKLFQVQVLLGDTIGKTGDFKNAVSYYKFALDAIQVNSRLDSLPTLSKKLLEAENLVQLGNFEMAFPFYQDSFKEIVAIYTITNVKISDGVCLAFFASENLSTIDAIIEANNLPESMLITFGRNLKVPSLKN